MLYSSYSPIVAFPRKKLVYSSLPPRGGGALYSDFFLIVRVLQCTSSFFFSNFRKNIHRKLGGIKIKVLWIHSWHIFAYMYILGMIFLFKEKRKTSYWRYWAWIIRYFYMYKIFKFYCVSVAAKTNFLTSHSKYNFIFFKIINGIYPSLNNESVF